MPPSVANDSPAKAGRRNYLATLAKAIDPKEGILEAIPSVSDPNGDDVGTYLEQLAERAELGQTTRFRIKGGVNTLKSFVRKGMPTITIGSQHSAITNASLQSQQDPAMASMMMLGSGEEGALDGQGARDAGMPLRITPSELSLDTYGCPLYLFGQQFFVDFGTNTSIDNVYAIAGISHTLTPSEFKSSLKMRPLLSYGKYRVLGDVLGNALKAIGELTDD